MYRYLERRLAQRMAEFLLQRYPGAVLPNVVIEPPPKVELGDFAIPLSPFAKPLRSAPLKVAETIRSEIGPISRKLSSIPILFLETLPATPLGQNLPSTSLTNPPMKSGNSGWPRRKPRTSWTNASPPPSRHISRSTFSSWRNFSTRSIIAIPY